MPAWLQYHRQYLRVRARASAARMRLRVAAVALRKRRSMSHTSTNHGQRMRLCSVAEAITCACAGCFPTCMVEQVISTVLSSRTPIVSALQLTIRRRANGGHATFTQPIALSGRRTLSGTIFRDCSTAFSDLHNQGNSWARVGGLAYLYRVAGRLARSSPRITYSSDSCPRASSRRQRSTSLPLARPTQAMGPTIPPPRSRWRPAGSTVRCREATPGSIARERPARRA